MNRVACRGAGAESSTQLMDRSCRSQRTLSGYEECCRAGKSETRKRNTRRDETKLRHCQERTAPHLDAESYSSRSHEINVDRVYSRALVRYGRKSAWILAGRVQRTRLQELQW